MMQWAVVKTGIERFDLLHVYGLGALLATLSGSPVAIEDRGVLFSLEGTTLPSTLPVTEQFLEENLLPLPTGKEVQLWSETAEPCPFSIRLFDGLLAALITIPGPKVFSVSDAVRKQQHTPETMTRALEKVRKQIQRWKRVLQQGMRHQQGWIADLFRDYQPHQPTPPRFARKKEHGKDISVLMAIDAFFGYDLRNIHNDAQMMEKANVAVREAHYATLLVFIGASRFLRAQCLAADHVALFLPGVLSGAVAAETALPILSPIHRSMPWCSIGSNNFWLRPHQEIGTIASSTRYSNVKRLSNPFPSVRGSLRIKDSKPWSIMSEDVSYCTGDVCLKGQRMPLSKSSNKPSMSY